MIGFLGCISKNANLHTEEYDYFRNKPFIEGEYHFEDFHIRRKINDKFLGDKVFLEDEDIFIAVDGVLLNARNLRNEFGLKNNFELLKFLYVKYGNDFIKHIKGDFSLALYNKETRELFLSTNTTATKPIYYYENDSELFFSSNSYTLFNELKARKHSCTLNEMAFYSIASLGYVLSDQHFVKEIRKIRAGHFLSFNTKKGLNIQCYFLLNSFPQLKLQRQNYLDEINEYFNDAIKLQYEKDLEYNYQHLITLSGGLDSRMTLFGGHQMGYKNSRAITFSSKGYWDEIISKTISKKLGVRHSVLQIEEGNYLEEYEPSLFLNGGLLSYYVSNQALDLYNLIDFSKFGLIHTGQVGDAIIGCTLQDYPIHIRYGYVNNHYKAYYYEFIEPTLKAESEKWGTYEMMRFYNHVHNFTLQGNQYSYPYTESVSPFLDNDLIKFCMRIPLQHRKNHKLYYSWIKEFYPKAGSFFYEKTRKRTINRYNSGQLNDIHNKITLLYLRSFKGLKDRNNKLLDYQNWYNSNNVNKRLEELFRQKCEEIEDSQLRENLKVQFSKNAIHAKLKALHAVLTYELYFAKK